VVVCLVVKKEDYFKFFIILVAVIMGFSMLATFLYKGNDTTNTNSNTTVEQPIEFQTSFNANVTRLFDTYIVAIALDKNAPSMVSTDIDTIMYKGEGVIRIRSEMFTSNGVVYYRAEFSLKKNQNIQNTFSSVAEKTAPFFGTSVPEVIRAAIVNLPTSIKLIKTDINFEKDYSPDINTISAYVSQISRVGDSVGLTGTITTTGKKITSSFLYEEKNNTFQVGFKSISAKGIVKTFTNEVDIEGSLKYTKYLDENELKLKLAKADVNAESINYYVVDSINLTSTDANTANKISVDLNAINGVSAIKVTSEIVNATIDLQKISAILNSIKTIEGKYKNTKVETPNNSLSVKTNTTQVNAVLSILNNFDFNSTAKRKVIFDSNALQEIQPATIIKVQNIDAFVSLNVKENEMIELVISGYDYRDYFEPLMAVQKE
jgi:hypothetical protein